MIPINLESLIFNALSDKQGAEMKERNTRALVALVQFAIVKDTDGIIRKALGLDNESALTSRIDELERKSNAYDEILGQGDSAHESAGFATALTNGEHNV